MKKIRPKALYIFENYGLNKHTLGEKCEPKLVGSDSFGTKWLCGHMRNTFMGYDKRKAAEACETVVTYELISMHHQWIQKLKRLKG